MYETYGQEKENQSNRNANKREPKGEIFSRQRCRRREGRGGPRLKAMPQREPYKTST